ncbi:MAG: hypothetical protein ACE5HI_18770 [bacterium]
MRKYAELKRTRFFSDPNLKQIEFKLRWERVEDSRGRIAGGKKLPDDNTVKSFLMSFRHFYLVKSCVNFGKICNLLRKRIEVINDPIALADLARIHSSYKDALKTRLVDIITGKKNYTPKEIIDLWFNGIYFHTDPKKVKEIDKILADPLHKDLFYFFLVGYVITLTNQVTELKSAVVWALDDNL